jgi:hypothetical protein
MGGAARWRQLFLMGRSSIRFDPAVELHASVSNSHLGSVALGFDVGRHGCWCGSQSLAAAAAAAAAELASAVGAHSSSEGTHSWRAALPAFSCINLQVVTDHLNVLVSYFRRSSGRNRAPDSRRLRDRGTGGPNCVGFVSLTILYMIIHRLLYCASHADLAHIKARWPKRVRSCSCWPGRK